MQNVSFLRTGFTGRMDFTVQYSATSNGLISEKGVPDEEH
jgi:hypothetical protein